MTARTILPGTYGCVPSNSTVGWFIEHGTASPYGHAFIVMTGGKVAEARPGGSGPADLERYVKMGAVFNDGEPLTLKFRRDVVEWAYSHEGAPYDWSAIGNLALRAVPFLGSHEVSPWLPVGKHGAYICSQYVSVAYTACGKVMFPAEDRWTVSPRSLADRVTARVWEDSAAA